MNCVLKTFLLWLMIAALPLQGMAAVVKASCGPRHHAMPPVAMAMMEHHHAAAGDAHDHTSAHQHTSAQDHTSAATSTLEPQALDDLVHAKSPKSSHCSACAFCCTGSAAPPTTLSLMQAPVHVEAIDLPSAVSFTGFIPAGPERPPRLVSA